MKVALVHYWLVGTRGGEKVLDSLCELFPDADIFTHVVIPQRLSTIARRHRIHTTFIAKLPLARKLYKFYVPLMPLALEQLDLTAYDLVISSEAGPAKGIIPAPGALHVCYCHTPMRYIWDMYTLYLNSSAFLTRIFIRLCYHYLRLCDVTSASRVDHFIANSAFVRSRIRQYYRRTSTVIHPPVEVHRFSGDSTNQGYYLYVGQLLAYKGVETAVDTFNELGTPLVVIGDGGLLSKLRRKARPNIRILGSVADHDVTRYLLGCRAFIFPGTEDFGITPVEAMACGKPVIAHRSGGALETVQDGVTGLFFDKQDAVSLREAIAQFEKLEGCFDEKKIRSHAARFGVDRFKAELIDVLIKYAKKPECRNDLLALKRGLPSLPRGHNVSRLMTTYRKVGQLATLEAEGLIE